MKDAKELDGKRVYLMIDATTRGGTVFKAGDVGVFRKQGVVRCMFTTDDGRQLEAGKLSRLDFIIASPAQEKT
jgi:hypothetical protein